MLEKPLLLSLLLVVSVLLLKPIFDYFRNAKGLRRFPGMTLIAPFTNLSYMWTSFHGKRYMAIHKGHKKHKIIRVGPNSLSFNDVQAVKDIHGHGTVALKDDWYSIQAGTHRNLADVKDRADHSRKRRNLAAAYAISSIVRWEHIVADCTRVLVEQYDRRCVKPGTRKSEAAHVDHRYWMNLFSIDAINEIGLSAAFKLLENASDLVDAQTMDGKRYRCHYRQALEQSHRLVSWFVWATEWFSVLTKIAAWHPYWRHKVDFDNICVYQCQRRLNRYLAGEKLDDFFAFLLHDKYGNANMLPMGELVAECAIMMNAGSDTTAIALTNVLYHLLKNGDCLSRLQDEIDRALEPDDMVAPYDKVKHLLYLRACLDESLRLTPPNTMSVPRQTPPEGMSIMGHWIPGNTTVHTPPYTKHRNEEIFPEPEAYRPERWLDDKASALQSHFIAFSAGPRGCIGRNITYFEQVVVLSTLIHRYTFQLISKDWELPQMEAFTCSPGAMPVFIRRR